MRPFSRRKNSSSLTQVFVSLTSDLPPIAAFLKWAISRMSKNETNFIPLEKIEEKGIKIFSLNDILLNE